VNHTLLYFGPFERNFRSLSADTTKYVDWGSNEQDAEGATERARGGLKFRYMRWSRSPEQDFVVGVDHIMLRAPVLLVHGRHMDAKWFAANNPSYLGDESAMRLLVDMIVANPEYRDELGRLVRSLCEA
jgi:hypothetical protein